MWAHSTSWAVRKAASPARRATWQSADARLRGHGLREDLDLRALSGRAPPYFRNRCGLGRKQRSGLCNSVLRARTNRYGDYLDITCAIAGRAPDCRLHLPENRRATIVFDVGGLSAHDSHPEPVEGGVSDGAGWSSSFDGLRIRIVDASKVSVDRKDEDQNVPNSLLR